jgi:hypothetical protein
MVLLECYEARERVCPPLAVRQGVVCVWVGSVFLLNAARVSHEHDTHSTQLRSCAHASIPLPFLLSALRHLSLISCCNDGPNKRGVELVAGVRAPHEWYFAGCCVVACFTTHKLHQSLAFFCAHSHFSWVTPPRAPLPVMSSRPPAVPCPLLKLVHGLRLHASSI